MSAVSTELAGRCRHTRTIFFLGWKTNYQGEDEMDARKITCLAAATFVGSLLILSATSPVHSQPPVVVEGRHYFDPEIQRVVPYGDLDLANPPGQNRLIRRVGYAVNDVCEVKPSRDFVTYRESRLCSTAAWSGANPQITAAFERAKSGSYVAATALIISTAQ
jgi:UrcA family protein